MDNLDLMHGDIHLLKVESEIWAVSRGYLATPKFT